MDSFDDEKDKSTIERDIARLEEIQLGFRRNLSNLHQIIGMLESEPEWRGDTADLKQDVESRARFLEDEVEQLREDLQTIRNLLGLNLEKKKSGKT
jgi:hypothetical protein